MNTVWRAVVRVEIMLLGVGSRYECVADVTEQLPHVAGSILAYCLSRKMRVDFQVGKGCFIINGTKPLGLPVLSKSVLAGIKILLFWHFYFLHL